MCLCCNILGWGSLDVEKLENLIEEYDLDIYDIKEQVTDKTDINEYFYQTLYLASLKIKEALKKWLDENEDVKDCLEYEFVYDTEQTIDEFEPNIYTNYLDSGFDSCFAEFDINSYDNDNYYNLIENIFGVSKLDIQKYLDKEVE